MPTGQRITAIGLAVAVVAFAAVGGLGWFGYQSFLDSKGVIVDVKQEAEPESLLPDTPALLVVQTAASGEVTGLTALVETPSRQGGWVIDVPINVLAPMPDTGGTDLLARAYDIGGGADTVLQATEGLLGVAFDGVEAVGLDELATAIAPYEPFTVTLTDPVPDPFVEGELVIDAGTYTDLSAQQVARLLTTSVPSETPVITTDRREALWDAVMDRVSEVSVGAPSEAVATSAVVPTTSTSLGALGDEPPPTTADFVASIGAGEHVTTTVTTQFVCTDNIFTRQLVRHMSRLLMAKSMPSRVIPSSPSARVRVVNPLENQDLLVNAAQAIDFGEFNLIMAGSGGADDVPAQTRYQYADEAWAPAVTVLQQFLGEGTVEQVDDAIDGVDVTVTLGQNFADRIAAEAAATPSTTQPACGAA